MKKFVEIITSDWAIALVIATAIVLEVIWIGGE